MKPLCKRAGVKSCGFHALWRYVASLLADTYKISAKTIQRILRHNNVTHPQRGTFKMSTATWWTTINLLSEKG